MKLLFPSFLFVIYIGLIRPLSAHERLIVGKVTTFEKYPLKNVSVILKSTKNEYFSDSTGHFSFICDENEKIIVNAQGFTSETIKISDCKAGDTIHLNLQLKKGEKNFKYATGYDYISEEQLSSAIKHFESSADYSAYNSILEILEGRVTGLTLTGHSINLRNTQVLQGGDVDALLVVDGVIVEYPVFIHIPPSEVKSIDVLKGAAASARYGSRGLGGVIVLKTKASD